MRFILIACLFKLIIQSKANGPGSVFVYLVSYINPSGKTDNGVECDSWFNQFVHDKCDLVFGICLRDVEHKNPNVPCNVGYISTLNNIFHNTLHVRFDSSIGFIPNPFNFTLTSMPENLKILINITDDDISGQQLISQMQHVFQLPIIGHDEDLSGLNQIVLSSLNSEMIIKVYGQCKEFYYGPGCSQYCKPSFSLKTGFYACDKVSGQKHCLIGWSGMNCTERDMCILDNPCHGSASCSMNESVVNCICPDSLEGQYCQTSKRPCGSSPCSNGGLCVLHPIDSKEISQKTVCVCPRNFTGETCEHDVNECISSPCKNDAKCVNVFGSYNCICMNNHWGVNCEKPPVFSVKGIDPAYFIKSSTARFMQNTIIVLLVTVMCLVFIIGLLSLLYYRNRSKITCSPSAGSVYSEIQNDEKFTHLTDTQIDPNDQYINYYELESDDLTRNVHLNPNGNFKAIDQKICEKESVI